jgi:GMP synthase (glutamine-hydrolysing)
MLRLLVADGGSIEGRRRMVEMVGATAAESYADVLHAIAPDAVVDICTPADEAAALPAALDSYDGIALTGSALNIYKREPEALRQIEFVRAAFARGLPMFGSCWGLQLATVAAGGDVALNPRGREVAFARRITPTDPGSVHAMHAGRPAVFDAPAIHSDVVTRLPPGAVVTARNALSDVQAAEIRVGASVFWGVQYHPEFRLLDVAAIVRRYGAILVDEGFFADLPDLERYAAELDTLEASPDRRDIAWRLNLADDITDERLRWCELANWIARVRAGREAG